MFFKEIKSLRKKNIMPFSIQSEIRLTLTLATRVSSRSLGIPALLGNTLLYFSSMRMTHGRRNFYSIQLFRLTTLLCNTALYNSRKRMVNGLTTPLLFKTNSSGQLRMSRDTINKIGCGVFNSLRKIFS